MAIEIERYLGKYLSMLIQAYNPDRYYQLMELRFREYARFFFITLAISLIFFVLTFLPMAMKFIGGMPSTLQEVQTLEISAEVEADHKVLILDTPSMVLNLDHEGEYDEEFLFTRAGVHYPKFIFFGEDFISWADLSNLKEPTKERDSLLFGLLMFLLPSIIFWVAVVSVLKLVLTFLFLVLLGYWLPRLFRHRITFRETVKTGILAMPSVMLIGVGFSPLAPRPLFWWGFALTLVVFSIGIVLLADRVTRRRKKYK